MTEHSNGLIRLLDRPACYLCGSSGHTLYAGLSDRLFGVPGAWRLVQCQDQSCGLVWLDPAPAEDDLGAVYEHYFTHEASPPAWRSRNALYRSWVSLGGMYRAAIRTTAIGRARQRAEAMYLDNVRPGRLLDVGCGDGSTLVRMRERGWRVEGQEIDVHAAEHARQVRGIDVHIGPLAEHHLPAEIFDAITLSHVIEHVYDPVSLLVECRRLLKPGGRLVALTPNIASYGHRRYNADWAALDPPRHVFLFSVATLFEVARRSGLQRVVITTNSVRAQFIGTASEDIRRTGRHTIDKTYTLGQLARAMAFELRAWAVLRHRPDSGEELTLEAER
jgi:SAM-dependent methyltransferase